MGGMIPLTDASRRPLHFPIVAHSHELFRFFVQSETTSGRSSVVEQTLPKLLTEFDCRLFLA